MTQRLALFGGPKAFDENVMRFNTIGKEEALAAKKVVDSGILSQFLGCWNRDFYGGPKVKEFEQRWSDHFGVKHSISTNSCTSGLMVAVGAIGVEPGDEVIVSPWTMTATATSILIWNAIPVFADIEDETFNLDPVSIEGNITPYTKAIVVTNIFGHAARLNEIISIAKKYNLKVIEDNAQAPNALYHGKYTGTIADIGVFSLNYHKHIHTGEGGVNVTDNDELAERMQLIRNHAEAVVEGKGVTNLVNMIGFNLRMPEMEAAIGIEQLKKLPYFVEEKIKLANMLNDGFRDLKGLRIPVVRQNCSHVYYSYPLIIDDNTTDVSRERIFEALMAEGIPALGNKYENLHLLPIYQKRIAYGSKGFPWNTEFYKGNVSYKKGICPVSESMYDSRFMNIGISLFKFDEQKVQKIINGFRKVWDNLDLLK